VRDRPATVALNHSIHDLTKPRMNSPPTSTDYSASPILGDHNSLRKSDGDLKISSEFFMVNDSDTQPLLKDRRLAEADVTSPREDEKKRIQSTIGMGRIRPTSALYDGDSKLDANPEYPYLVPNISNNNTKSPKRHSADGVDLINQSTVNNYGSDSSDDEDFTNQSIEAHSPSSMPSSPGFGSVQSESVVQPAWHKTSPSYGHHATNSATNNNGTSNKQVKEESAPPSGTEAKQELSQMVPDLISLCDDILASTEVIVSVMTYGVTVISSGKQRKSNQMRVTSFPRRKLPR
jgi:hypothetical protein